LSKHQWNGATHGKHRSVEIDREDSPPRFIVDIGDGGEQVHHTGIVHQDINPAELSDRAIDHR
jgi:hypothetical protein